jgi:hypothetical protein
MPSSRRRAHRSRREAPGGEVAGQLATRTFGISARISRCSDEGWAWTSPEIWPAALDLELAWGRPWQWAA